MFCLLRTEDTISLCTSCNYCLEYINEATRSQINSYQSIRDEFNNTYDYWEGDRFTILLDDSSENKTLIIEKLKSYPYSPKRWTTDNPERIQSILYKLSQGRSPDKIAHDLRVELANLVIQLPWELVEDRELVPKDKDLQKFLRKASALAKKSNGLLAIRNRAKADVYLRVLSGIVGCFVKINGENLKAFRLVKPYEQSIEQKIKEML